jgi:hypothetical protein
VSRSDTLFLDAGVPPRETDQLNWEAHRASSFGCSAEVETSFDSALLNRSRQRKRVRRGPGNELRQVPVAGVSSFFRGAPQSSTAISESGKQCTPGHRPRACSKGEKSVGGRLCGDLLPGRRYSESRARVASGETPPSLRGRKRQRSFSAPWRGLRDCFSPESAAGGYQWSMRRLSFLKIDALSGKTRNPTRTCAPPSGYGCRRTRLFDPSGLSHFVPTDAGLASTH